MVFPARWVNVALANLALAAVLGALMRFIFLAEVPGVEYRYVMHAHSHGAMLGWVFPVLYAGYVFLVQPTPARTRWYLWLFWVNAAAALGMFGAFTVQGYGPISIVFTTLHLFLSYAAVAMLWPDLRRRLAGWVALPWLLAGLASIVIATGGIWTLASIMASRRPNMEVYYLAIQFFLHWQLNGWFLFATLGLVLALLERRHVPLPRPALRWAFRLLAIGTPLTYGLAVAWAERHWAIYTITGVGVVLQLVAIGLWLRAIAPALRILVVPLPLVPRLLWGVGLGSVAFKSLIHAAVALPYVARMAFTVRNYVIGFVHVVTLGATTLTVLALLHTYGALPLGDFRSRLGIGLLLLGFLLTEALLFLQGTMFWLEWSFLPHYYLVLFAASLPLPIGTALLVGTVTAPLTPDRSAAQQF